MSQVKLFVVLIVTILISLPGYSQNKNEIDKMKLKEIGVEIDNFIKEGDVPAISVSLVKNGHITYINRGNFSRVSKRKINENAIFQTASISKMLTAIMINSLLIEGKIALNESIVTYLPSDYLEKTIEKLRPITIRDLLHHRSGLPGSSKIYRKHRKNNQAFRYNYTEEDFKTDLKAIKLKNRVGEKFYYSNFGYALLGYIAERATKKSYDNLVKEYVGAPYDLLSTSVNVMATNNLVTAYRKDKRQIEIEPWVMGKLTPPSGLFSSTSDLANLMLHQLKAYEGSAVNPLVLTNDTRPCQPDSGISYGFGFRVYGASGTYGHGGEMDGFAGDYSICPNQSKGHTILTSCSGDEVYKLSRKIAGILY